MTSLSRRHFLATAGAVGAAGVAATVAAPLASAAPTAPADHSVPNGRYRIDVHAHALPTNYRAALIAAGITTIGGVPTPQWSEAAALDFMKRYGIQAQVLSISSPGVSFLTGQDQIDLARSTNLELQAVVNARPSRFGALGVLPLPNIDAAVAEAVYALDVLHLDGIGVLSNYHGLYLGDQSFFPLWAELDARGAYVFIHPETPEDDDRPALPLPPFLFEFPFDTTRAIVQLEYAGVFRRFPNIRWQGAHAGGTIPFLSFRTSLAAAQTSPAAALAVLADYAKLRYDTALSDAPAAQSSVLKVTSLDNVVFGSDWPFAAQLYPAAGDPQPSLSLTYTRAQRLKVERLNALREFPRLAAAQ